MDVAESIDVAAPPADLALAAESERKDDEKTARRAAEKEWEYTISFWLETLATKNRPRTPDLGTWAWTSSCTVTTVRVG